MQIRMVQKYDFHNEVLPSLVIGILFDLLGRYACVHALQPFTIWLSRLIEHSDTGLIASAGDQVFLDMAGTFYTAVMVGPWWAAVVGVTSNAINGGFYDAYFPFGVVNILGGLAWGYYAERRNIRARIAERRPGFRELASLYGAMVFIGGLVGGIGSALTHLILYPPMHHPLAMGSVYEMLRPLPIFAHAANDIKLMFAGDMVRDYIDKAMVVLTGLLWVLVAPAVLLGIAPPPRAERYKTDTVSVFAFAIVYSLFLLAARIAKPELKFLPSDHQIAWMHYPLAIAWLYIPIALSLVAFLLFTYDSQGAYGRQIDARRAERQRLFRDLTPPTPWLFVRNEYDKRVTQGHKVYGLIASLVFWPIGKDMDEALSLSIYFGVTMIAIAAYFYQNDKFVKNYRVAARHLASLHQWMDVTNLETTAQFLSLLTERIAAGLRGSASALRVFGQLVYQPIYVPHNLGAAAGGKGTGFAGTTGGRVVLIAVVTGRKIVDASVRRDVDTLLDAISPNTMHVVSLTSGGEDPELQDWLKSIQRRDVEVGLLSWYDVEDVIGDDRRPEAAQVLVKARLRTLDLISTGKPMMLPADATDQMDPVALAARALPSLAHVIDHLAPGSTILDLGAGRGRHTLYSLQAGHTVVAVERKPETLTDLRRAVGALGKAGARGKILAQDYKDLDPQDCDAADLIIITGVLQHAKSLEDLTSRLTLLGALATNPGARIFLEMLFDMRFDGKPAGDGRLAIDVPGFEETLRHVFPARTWTVERVAGPTHRKQDFSEGPRSFLPSSRIVELAVVEYLIVRQD